MSQILNQKLEQVENEKFNITLDVWVKPRNKIKIEYMKIYENSKDFGMFNDTQIYESVSIETLINFMKAKKLVFSDITFLKSVKDMAAFMTAVHTIRNALS